MAEVAEHKPVGAGAPTMLERIFNDGRLVRDEHQAAGARRMFLEVDAGNEPAIRLYRKGGFIDAGLRKGYYRDGADAVVMALDLAPPG